MKAVQGCSLMEADPNLRMDVEASQEIMDGGFIAISIWSVAEETEQ